MITMARYGDSAVAGTAILGRIVSVAFAGVFALSSAIGPIIGQNAAALRYDRVRQTLLSALLFNVLYVLVVWLLLYVMSSWIIEVFDAKDDAAYLIRFYCQWLVIGFIFNGMLFMANASFNNLHRAYYATSFNFCRALLGTVPMVYLFSKLYGPPGVMAGEMVGALVFGVAAYIVVLRLVARLERDSEAVTEDCPEADEPAQWAYSSENSQLGQNSALVEKD